MGKPGRNELCPCGSGKKYKHCCSLRDQVRRLEQSAERPKVTLESEVKKIKEAALNKKDKIREVGVFILFSNQNGDAWLLEITDSDAVQLAANGEILETIINENPQTIEIDWSHHYKLENKQLVLLSYKGEEKIYFDREITQQLCASMKRTKKRCTPALLRQVHLSRKEL